jgi:hypothetical protein
MKQEPSPATPSLRFGAATSPDGRGKNRRYAPYITRMRPQDILMPAGGH